jgi:hypothetical protein
VVTVRSGRLARMAASTAAVSWFRQHLGKDQ